MGRDAPLWWEGGALWVVDQRALPQEFRTRRCTSWEEVAEAIRRLEVRGAPAIGLAAAYGLALAARACPRGDREACLGYLGGVAARLRAARPTAANLGWALDRLLAAATKAPEGEDLADLLARVAEDLARRDRAVNQRIGEHGAPLLPPGARVLTYCNTGMLATGGYGTALGIVRAAHARGQGIRVIVCETRPVLQGARLTAWELLQEAIPATLITDNAAGALMRAGEVDAVLVGADRIAANGDVANKVGTYTLAVLARAHGIPFYVAAPTSTIDLATPDGASIPIEERDPEEVTTLGGIRVAPAGIAVRNPAFDVTPHELASALITEVGVIRPPYGSALERLAAVEFSAAGAGV
jgi:methylthioribose-1-phosphate isomerase